MLNCLIIFVLFINLTINFGCEKTVYRDFNKPTLNNNCCENKKLNKTKANQTFDLFISTSGSDYNSGKNSYNSIATLKKAQDILKKNKINIDVRIYIDSGLYKNQFVTWDYFNNSNIIFLGLVKNHNPIFDGEGEKIWFNLIKKNGTCSNVTIMNIDVINYKQGIVFNGDRDNPYGGWNGNNKLINLKIKNIGTLYSIDTTYSSSAVCFINSRFNIIKNCYFTNIENDKKNKEDILIHALYFAHYSSNNIVEKCNFSYISGDPIRVRDESNNNIINKNIFTKTGSHAFFSEWFCCSETTSKKCTKESGECSSFGNQFINNLCNRGYNNTKIQTYDLYGENSFTKEVHIERLISKRNKIK